MVMCAALMGMLAFTGCSESPRDVAVKWGKAVLEGDLKKANEYSTDDSAALNGLIIGMCSQEKKNGKSEISDTIKKWETGNEEINGDTARVYGDQGPDKGSITLKKVDGKWKVNAKKEASTKNDKPENAKAPDVKN